MRDIIEAATAASVIRMVLYMQEGVRGTYQLAVMQNPTSLIDFFPRLMIENVSSKAIVCAATGVGDRSDFTYNIPPFVLWVR